MALDLVKTNLSAKAETGVEFELMLPSLNEGTGAYITVRGTNSPRVKAHSKRVFSQMQAKEQNAKRRGKEVDQMSLDEAEEMAIDSAIIRVIGWRGITEDEKEIEFNDTEARRIFKEHDWIRAAVLEESDNVANFI